ncbi:MAG: M16 family metallopeptidase [Fidelibacterota bacterium]
MIRKLFKLTILAVIILTGCEQQQSASAHMYKVNGLEVIIKEIPETDVVSAGFYLRGGVAATPGAQAGIEQLLLMVAPKGTETYDKQTLQQLLEGMGSEISGYASRDYSVLSLRCLADKFDSSWKIYQDVILQPLLDSSEVELARTSILTDIKAEVDNPDSYLKKLAREFYYEGHPYEQSPNGTINSVSHFTREDLLRYHQEQFTKSRALLVIVGPVDKQEILKQVRELASNLPRGNKSTFSLPESWEKASPGMRIVESNMPIPTNYLIGQTNAPSMLSDDYYPFLLAARKLQTRVWEEVRTKRNLSYAPSAGYESGRNSTSYLYVTTTQPDTAIKVMFAEVDRLKDQPLTDKELHDLRMMFLTRYYLTEETVAAQRSLLASYELLGKGIREADRFLEKIQAVRAADIQRVAKTYLNNYQFTYLGDPKQVNEEVFLAY